MKRAGPTPPIVRDDLTYFLGKRLRVHQPAEGYRFNVDSVLLAGFSRVREEERVLDLGTGCGILLLLAKWFHHPGRLTGVEIQPELARMARQNLIENGFDDEAVILEGDFRKGSIIAPASADLVVTNPPYYALGRGRPSPDPNRALARHDESCSLEDVLNTSANALAPKGRVCFTVPVDRLEEALEALQGAGLHPRIRRGVRSKPGSEPFLVLIQARRDQGKGEVFLPPLVIRNEAGSYTDELRFLLGELEPGGPRFFCDAMLGTLARYLRMIGFDTAYVRRAEDGWLRAEADRSGRILLTRDGELLTRARKQGQQALDPGSDVPLEQLSALRRALPDLGKGRSPRCLGCNALPLEVDRGEARGKVPPYTYLTQERFRACPCCGKLTWEGSHMSRFRRAVEEALSP